jgi:hypothetical protein
LITNKTNNAHSLYAVGKNDLLLTFSIIMECIPSKIEPTLRVVDWGDIQVLSPQFRNIEIENKSPLTVPYVASIVSRNISANPCSNYLG